MPEPIVLTIRGTQEFHTGVTALAHRQWKSINQLCVEILSAEVQKAVAEGMELPAAPPPKRTPKPHSPYVELYLMGYSVSAIAKLYRRDVQTVYAVLHSRGIKPSENAQRPKPIEPIEKAANRLTANGTP